MTMFSPPERQTRFFFSVNNGGRLVTRSGMSFGNNFWLWVEDTNPSRKCYMPTSITPLASKDAK